MVDIRFGTVPLGFGLGSMLKNTTQLSSEDMGNVALLPLAVPSYSIIRDISNEDRYADFIEHSLSIFEGVESSNGHSTKTFGADSILGCVSALSGKF